MAMDAGEVERLIKAKLPDAKVTIRDLVGDGDHLSARVVSQAFRGKTRVQQHQMVYEALAGRMGGTLHALALETSAPADGRSKATATTSEGVREPMSQQTDHDRIRTLVTGNDVVLFMKGTKNSPQCGFSDRVAQILQQLGVDYKDINVLDDATVRDGIKSYTNWPTIPQLYVKGEFVGGCDIVREMFQSGDLQELLNRKGVHDDKHPTPA